MAERHGIKRSPVDGQLRRLPLDAEPGGRSVEAGVFRDGVVEPESEWKQASYEMFCMYCGWGELMDANG